MVIELLFWNSQDKQRGMAGDHTDVVHAGLMSEIIF